MLNTERRSGMLNAELDEVRTSLEQTERTRRAIQSDHADAMERLSELQSSTTGFAATKRKLEADITAMQGDLEEAANEMRAKDEQTKKAMSDAARLADELRQEQDHAMHVEKARKQLENQVTRI